MSEQYILYEFKSIRSLSEFELLISPEKHLVIEQSDGVRLLSVGTGDLIKKSANSIGSSIVFQNIERYFQDLEIAPKAEWRRTINQRRHTRLTGHEFGSETYDQFPIQLTSKDQVLKWVKLVEKYFENDALPFFRHWKDITVFLPSLELDYGDTMGLYHVFGQSMTLKKCIVWYLTSHPEYKKYLNHQIAKFENKIRLDPMNKELKNAFNVFMERIDKLERDEPLFDWKPEFLNKQDS